MLPLVLLLLAPPAAAGQDMVAHWSFDEGAGTITGDSVTGTQDAIGGLYKYVQGVSGNALRFDGYTTVVTRKAANVPRLGDAFTIEAWVAIQTYPWTWCAIVDHEHDEQAGYYFGIDPEGRFGLHLAVDDLWQTASSHVSLPLYQWNHLVGSYSPTSGVRLYLNGKLVRTVPIQGRPTFAENTNLLIGRNNEPRPLAFAVRYALPSPFSRPLPAPISLDGIIDEAKIYGRALSDEEIEKTFAKSKPSGPDPLDRPVLPSGPKGPGRFGAYYTRLLYTDAWEAPWRVGNESDVVVRFDEAPYRFVFWRGTRVPCWVTENGIWYSNEFFEVWDADMKTGAEPLADKQTRFSHVRIIESNDARVVLHWRYAPVQIDYELAHVDATGWGDWVDEYYVIYPDGAGVRKMKVWTSSPHRIPGTGSLREFQESIIVNPPGTRPEDNIKMEALTLANLKGESHTYSWATGAPGLQAKLDEPTVKWLETILPGAGHPGRAWLTEPPNANIHLVNLKANYSPYVIVDPNHVAISAYGSERSIFPWWNHWPVAQIMSFGRYAVTPDRASHSSVTHIYWPPLEETENTVIKIMLNGMTNKPAVELVPLARSWLSPPALEIGGEGFTSEGYDPTQRAYVVTRHGNGRSPSLELTFRANEQSPIVNPAILIRGWGESDAALRINGEPVAVGKDFRLGHVYGLESSDIVIWIRQESTHPTRISISAVSP